MIPKKAKKYISFLVVVTCLVLMTAGCQNTNSQKENSEAKPASSAQSASDKSSDRGLASNLAYHADWKDLTREEYNENVKKQALAFIEFANLPENEKKRQDIVIDDFQKKFPDIAGLQTPVSTAYGYVDFLNKNDNKTTADRTEALKEKYPVAEQIMHDNKVLLTETLKNGKTVEVKESGIIS